MQYDRRQFLIKTAGIALSCSPLTRIASGQQKKGMRIVLLGTKGGPRLSNAGRRNASTLLLINDTPYLVDCGYGTSRQLLAAGVPIEKVRYVFITHHHSDHNLEYGALLYNAWVTGFPIRVDAYGPPGLEEMTRAFFKYAGFDIDTRIEDEGRPDLRKLVFAHDFARPGLMLQNNDVRVTACRVSHPPIKQAYAFRFDATDRSVVISGDTAYSSQLADFAKGADVLVHEVMYLPGIEALLKSVPNAARLRSHLLESHTVSEDVGKVAAASGVKTLVLSHLVPGDDASISDEQWAEGARRHFKGRIIVGKDLMEI